jgi:hypothetical protein
MTLGTLYLPKVDSRGDGTPSFRAAEWLSLGAAPVFAVMALLTGIHGGGMPDMICSAVQDPSPLGGMVPMYVLMSVFHVTPWLKFISSWRTGARAVDLTHEGGM